MSTSIAFPASNQHVRTIPRSPPSENSSSSSRLSGHGSKRRVRDRSEDGGRGDELDSKSGKRPRIHHQVNIEKQASGAKLACPYYKRDPGKYRCIRACCGPGWDSVHRLKSHLYRVHTMPPHCRRCYAIFKDEAQLTQHSRSTNTCVVGDASPLDGFDQEQEKQLRSRRSMFRASDEEEKWKIVYLILFPDTALDELPSAYHESTVVVPEEKERHLLRPPEIREYEAFMLRELPRKARTGLESILERKFGPIQETLKNELENIVRSAQQDLTSSYLSSAQNQALGPSSHALAANTGSIQQTSHENMETTQQMSDSLFDPLAWCIPSPYTEVDALSQFFIPPNTDAEPWIYSGH